MGFIDDLLKQLNQGKPRANPELQEKIGGEIMELIIKYKGQYTAEDLLNIGTNLMASIVYQTGYPVDDVGRIVKQLYNDVQAEIRKKKSG